MAKTFFPLCLFFHALMLYSFSASAGKNKDTTSSWIRINQLGYKPSGLKTAVWATTAANVHSKKIPFEKFRLVDSVTGKVVFSGRPSASFGAYGPFTNSCRINFTSFNKPGTYYIIAGEARSPFFPIAENVYAGAADFCLFYMRQQRSYFNPFLKDSCHTADGYTLYGPMPDSSFVDVAGGWHDASDYLQYSTTSANATYHLLAAYRDFPGVFSDEKQASGLNGKNGIPDVMDEAKWGLEWLLKMHPEPDIMFNQIADDRDHQGMRIPSEDSFYGRGNQRPVYFIDGNPQQRGKFLNATTGTSSTAAKFASAFALGSEIFETVQPAFSRRLFEKSISALRFAQKKPGVTQTVSVLSPYIYAEENWTDDMELAFASLQKFNVNKDYSDSAFYYATLESVTPWLYRDTANHYQYYPFINLGHYELAKILKDDRRDSLISWYRTGIELVWERARQNPFYRGIPFIWCSNNLTTSFAIQCYWFRKLTGDKRFAELEQANFDWLFGLNPWGTSMVYGLPANGDTPVDPHSAFTHLKNYPVNGGLIDGPVYTSIFDNLIGIKLYHPDTYEPFQSNLAVYHDDFGDYSTNEPTMDGTASLIYLLAAMENE